MTISLARYADESGLIAYIQQEKYCRSFSLVILRPIDGGPHAMTIYHGTYTTRSGARSAMNRFSRTWSKNTLSKEV